MEQSQGNINLSVQLAHNQGNVNGLITVYQANLVNISQVIVNDCMNLNISDLKALLEGNSDMNYNLEQIAMKAGSLWELIDLNFKKGTVTFNRREQHGQQQSNLSQRTLS